MLSVFLKGISLLHIRVHKRVSTFPLLIVENLYR